MEVLYAPDFKINRETAVTVGKFDGVHEGHRKIIEVLKKTAEEHGLNSIVYTFLHNPREILGEKNFVPLMTNEEKTSAISKLGVEYLVYEDFNKNFANMEPEEFVRDVLIKKLNAKVVVVGENFTFGRNKEGNIIKLEDFSKKYGFEVNAVKLLLKDGEVISSSGLRAEKNVKNVK